MTRRAILLSIKPEHVCSIENGSKRYEFRRVCPKIVTGDLALVYASSPLKELTGAFTIGEVVKSSPSDLWDRFGSSSGLSRRAFDDYFSGVNTGCAIEIECYYSLETKVALAEMRRRMKIEPPQSYRYIKTRVVGDLI